MILQQDDLKLDHPFREFRNYDEILIIVLLSLGKTMSLAQKSNFYLLCLNLDLPQGQGLK